MPACASAGGSGGGDGDDDSAMTPMQVAQMTCDEILEEVNEKRFPTDDVSRGMNEDDKGSYQFVFLQECEYMNALLYEMVKGLQEGWDNSRSSGGGSNVGTVSSHITETRTTEKGDHLQIEDIKEDCVLFQFPCFPADFHQARRFQVASHF